MKHPAAQLHIPVQQRQAVVNDRNQIIVNFCRNVVAGQRRIHGRCVSADSRTDDIGFYVIAVGGRQRVFLRRIGAVHVVEGILSHAAVLRLHQADVSSVRYLYLPPLLVFDASEFDVRVVEHGENIVGRRGDFAHLRQDIFFRLGKHVLLLSEDFIECVAVHRKSRRLLHILLHLAFRKL